MSKKMPAVIAVLSALLLAGCTGDVVTGASDDRLSTRSTSNKVPIDRPFEGDCDLVRRSRVFTSPTTVTQIVDGTCILSHLGRTTLTFTENIDFSDRSYSSVATFTAANGDELHATFNGFATPPSAAGHSIAGTMMVTGGSGRFVDASGSATQTGFVTGATATYHIEGRLAY